MRFEEYFSFEAIVGDLIRWRLRGKDLGGVLPPRRDWLRAGLKGRKGVPSEVVRRQAIWRTVMRAYGAELGGHARAHACAPCGFDFVECPLRSKASSVHFVTLPMRLGGTPRPTDATCRDALPDATRGGRSAISGF